MTLKDLQESNAVMIPVKEIAEFLGKDPQKLRNDIRAGRTNIPHIESGSRIYVLRTAFLETLGG